MVISANNPRQYHWHDHVLINTIHCMRTLFKLPNQNNAEPRKSPASSLPDNPLDPKTKKHSAALMRINHTGELCAQALYLGQSLTARDISLHTKLRQAAKEESDHLNWCAQRIAELNDHQSYLNPLWFIGSLCIGTCTGLLGDKWSLGFLAQTEHQVFEHLSKHLEKLSPEDVKSRAVISMMQKEEAQHADMALSFGAAELPTPAKLGMRLFAKLMTSVSYYL